MGSPETVNKILLYESQTLNIKGIRNNNFSQEIKKEKRA